MSDTNGDFAWLLALIPAFSNPVTAIIAVVVIVVVVVIAYVAIDHAIYAYNTNHKQYADGSGGISSKHSGKTGNPISDGMEKRIPNDQLTAPKTRGKAPSSVEDGKSVEIHHKNQNPDGPFEELSRTAHRLKDNFSKNHPNLGDKSRINRDAFKQQVKDYWRREWDSGRWGNKQ